MKSNFEIARQMARKGWPVIAVPAGEKAAYVKPVGTYDFNTAWSGASQDSNLAICCDDTVCVLDFDHKLPVRDTTVVYHTLKKTYPKMFRDSILERTQEGGLHAYFRGVPGQDWYIVNVNHANKAGSRSLEMIEVLARGRCCTCSPSRTPKGSYRVIGDRNFLNTRPEELPMLPEMFRCGGLDPVVLFLRDVCHLEGADVAEMPNTTPEDVTALKCVLLEAFVRDTRDRRNVSISLATHARGYGLGGQHIMDIIHDYYLRCPWNYEPGEPQRIVRHALTHIGQRGLRPKLSLIRDAYQMLAEGTV